MGLGVGVYEHNQVLTYHPSLPKAQKLDDDPWEFTIVHPQITEDKTQVYEILNF